MSPITKQTKQPSTPVVNKEVTPKNNKLVEKVETKLKDQLSKNTPTASDPRPKEKEEDRVREKKNRKKVATPEQSPNADLRETIKPSKSVEPKPAAKS